MLHGAARIRIHAFNLSSRAPVLSRPSLPCCIVQLQRPCAPSHPEEGARGDPGTRQPTRPYRGPLRSDSSSLNKRIDLLQIVQCAHLYAQGQGRLPSRSKAARIATSQKPVPAEWDALRVGLSCHMCSHLDIFHCRMRQSDLLLRQVLAVLGAVHKVQRRDDSDVVVAREHQHAIPNDQFIAQR